MVRLACRRGARSVLGRALGFVGIAVSCATISCGDDAPQTCGTGCESGGASGATGTTESSASSRGAGGGGHAASSTGETTGSGVGGSGASTGTGGSVPSDTIIPADRLPPPGTWESAGVEGGIPERTTLCADVTAAPYNADASGVTSAVAAIQAAIDQCPEGQVVFVPAGEYLIDGPLSLRTPITLRGAGALTTFRVETGSGTALHIGGLGPWPAPKANDGYRTPIEAGSARESTTVTVADTSAIEVGKMVMIDEEDDPDLVWTKVDAPGRYRASMHRVENKTATTVTFRPPLPIAFSRSPQISWFPDLTHDVAWRGFDSSAPATVPGSSSTSSRRGTAGWLTASSPRCRPRPSSSGGRPTSSCAGSSCTIRPMVGPTRKGSICSRT